MDNQDPYYYVVRLNDVQINQKSVSMVVESFHSNSSWNQFVPWSIREPHWPCFQRRYLINSNNCLWNNTPLFLLSLSHPTFWMVLMYWQVDPSSDWPELQFYFDGVIVSIPPSVYFVSHLQDGKEAWLFGIQSFAGYVFFSISLSHSTSFSETHLWRDYTLSIIEQMELLDLPCPLPCVRVPTCY